jgi:hypothetical protein
MDPLLLSKAVEDPPLADASGCFSLQASVRRTWRESSKRSSGSTGAGVPFRGQAIAERRSGQRMLSRHCTCPARTGTGNKSSRAEPSERTLQFGRLHNSEDNLAIVRWRFCFRDSEPLAKRPARELPAGAARGQTYSGRFAAGRKPNPAVCCGRHMSGAPMDARRSSRWAPATAGTRERAQLRSKRDSSRGAVRQGARRYPTQASRLPGISA